MAGNEGPRMESYLRCMCADIGAHVDAMAAAGAVFP